MSLNTEEEKREVPLDPEEATRAVLSDSAKETLEAPSDREDEARGTSPDSEEVVLEVPSDCEEDALEAPSDPEEEKREVPSDHEEEAKDAAGQTELEVLVVPARQKLNISGTLPQNNVKAHVESAGARRRGRKIITKFSADERGWRQRECVDVRRGGHDEFLEEGGANGADSEEHVTGAVNQQQTMNALEMKEWRKVRKKKCKVARLNDKLVVGARVIYNRKVLDRMKKSKSTNADIPIKVSGWSKTCTTHPPQRQR